MFIFREDVYKPDTDRQNIAEIVISKQRNGPTELSSLSFSRISRFEEKYNEG
jgi:replicative DNA helicase